MLILYNGNIRVSQSITASALAVQDGRVLAAGTDDQMLSLASSQCERYNLSGKTVWPGLIDAHIHLQHYALGLNFIDCEVPTRSEVIRRVKERAGGIQPGEWLRGHGWNQNEWVDGFGSASELDSAGPDNPVYLTAKSLHASWANSFALRIAGIDDHTPDPDGGAIGRDSSGKPNGILFESAMQLVEKNIPLPTVEKLAGLIEAAQTSLWKLGLTGVNDFDGPLCFQALQILRQNRRLKLRVTKSIPLIMLAQAVDLGLQSGFGDEFLRIGNIKCFSDGALGPRTAAMIAPYAGEKEHSGMLLMSDNDVFEAGRQAAGSGLALAVHAIGDLANRMVLNGYARLRRYEKENKLPALRHRIEHVQILHPDDTNRLADLGIIASVQPIHATSDMLMADRHWGQRSAGAYAYLSLQRSGAWLAFGSDAPVESPNPFLGLHAAVTRRRPDGSPGVDGWYPKQRLGLDDALAGFTTNAAYAGYNDNQLGTLQTGCRADLVVLPVNPFNIPTQELHTVQPVSTMVNGEWVWQGEE